jgi:glycosyltransferase involved in cell wall biosynthesis
MENLTKENVLISCICITKDRPMLLKRSVACFNNQNYPHKELILSYPSSDANTKMLIEELFSGKDLKFRIIVRDDSESLGQARNNAVAISAGKYICIWDDDDWYHPSRLSVQLYSIINSDSSYNASILTSILLFDQIGGKAFVSFIYHWENTLLCRKEIIMQNQYSLSNRGEDTHIVKFLAGKGLLKYIDDAPFLYIYIYHGGNVWDYNHYEYFLKNSTQLSSEDTSFFKNIIEQQ